MENKFYELTKYPKIYGQTYWGGFKKQLNDNDNNIEILINNRNNFIENYNIKKICNLKFIRKYVDHLRNLRDKPYNIDHLETYETFDKKYIIINSPYNSSKDNEYTENLLKEGWILINPLYSDHANTYIKFIDKSILKNI